MSRSADFSETEDGTFREMKSWAELQDERNKGLSTKRDTNIERRFFFFAKLG